MSLSPEVGGLGMIRTCPILKAVPDMLFAVCMVWVVVRKRLAIFQRESPFRTA